MPEYAIYIETLHSILDPAKNTRGEKAVGTIETYYGAGENTRAVKVATARAKFDFKPNEQPFFVKMPRWKIHAQGETIEGKTRSLCGKYEYPPYMSALPVNCKFCLRIISNKDK